MGRPQIIALSALLVVAVVGFFTFRDLPIRSAITDFVPTADGDEEVPALMRALSEAEHARTIALNLGPTDELTAARASGMMGERLRAVPGIARVENAAPDGIDRAMYELYFRRRYAFFAPSAGEVVERTTDAALQERARALRSALTGPTAMLVRRVAPEDPLLVFDGILRALEGEGEGHATRLVDEHLVVDDPSLPDGARSFGVVLVHTEGTTFSADRQGPVLEAIDAAFAAVAAELDTTLHLEQASVHRFAVHAERALRADTQRISTLSMVFIAVLFVLLFRGPRYLLLGAIPLAVGTVLGTLSVRLLWGGVHGITLAFGSAMLGVGIDFVGHYVGHHVLEPDADGPHGTMRRIWPGLLLGASTTVLGIGALGLTTLPGMQELALFSAVGVFGALLATRFLLPPFMPAVPAPTALHVRLARSFEGVVRRVLARPRLAVIPAVLAVLVAAVGLSRLTFDDDLRRLNGTDPDLAAEDRRVRERLAHGEAGRFAVAVAADDERALVLAEAMDGALREAARGGELGSHRSATAMLRSSESQRAVLEALRADRSLPDRTLGALEREGFVRAMFEPFGPSLFAEVEPLTPGEVLGSPLASLLAPLRLEMAQEGDAPARVAYLALLSGVHDPVAIDTRLRQVGARLFDQAGYLRAAYAAFRRRAISLVLGGLVLVLGLCWARYRDVRLAVAAIGPAAISSAATLGLVALMQGHANLMHLVACLLVLSMGEDYAVFLLESRADPKGIGTTMVGLLLACVTTVLSFGLLALSSHPALQALGMVTSVGVLLSLFLAPLSLLAAPRMSVGAAR